MRIRGTRHTYLGAYLFGVLAEGRDGPHAEIHFAGGHGRNQAAKRTDGRINVPPSLPFHQLRMRRKAVHVPQLGIGYSSSIKPGGYCGSRSPADSSVDCRVEVGTIRHAQGVVSTHLVRVPDGADPARFLMAQQYGTTLYAMRTFWPEEGRNRGTCAIIGAGSAGLFFVQLAKRMGFDNIIVSDLNAERLAVAAKLGADLVLKAPEESLVDGVLELTGGVGADLVVEAAGYDECRAESIAAVRPLGIVGFFGFPERVGDSPFPQYSAFRKVARIQWAGATQSEPGLLSFRDAVRDIHEGRIEVDCCLGERYRLEELPDSFGWLGNRAAAK